MGGKIDGDIILSAGLDTKNISKSIEGLKKSISKGLKNVIRIGFGVRSVFALIRKLRSALIEGFQNLAQVHEPFNSAMSELMTSLNLLKNTFAATFAPIIEVVAPILSRFINMMAEAVSQIGQFIAALTGKEYIRAGAVQMDYAEATNKSASSSKNAAKATKEQNRAAKELKKTLAGFDDVEILHEDKDKDNDTDTAITPPTYSFTPTPIGQAVSQFAANFKAAWAKADFTDIGRLVGEKVKNALDNIPWDTIKETLQKIASSIATFLNGYLSTPGLFYSIGTTIAQALNSAFEFVNEFAKKFNWSVIGTVVRDRILGVLQNIDWQLIYNTARNLGSGIGTAIVSTLTNLPWDDIRQALTNAGTAIATFLNSVLSQPNLGARLGTSLSNMINSAIKGLQNFIQRFDWKNLGTQIHDFIANAINGINWTDVYNTFRALGTNIAVFLNAVLANPGFGTSIGRTLSNMINVAIAGLRSFIQKFDWKNLGVQIHDFLAAAISGIKWTDVFDTLKALGSGLMTTINETLSDPKVFAAILVAIGLFFLKFRLNFKKILVAAIAAILLSVDTDFKELGKELASKLNTAIEGLSSTDIGEAFATIVNNALDLIAGLIENTKFDELAKKIASNISIALKKINWAQGGYSLALVTSKMASALKSFVDEMDWASIGKAASDFILKAWTTMDWTAFGSTLGSIISGLAAALALAIKEFDWLGVASAIVTGVVNGVSAFIGSIVANLIKGTATILDGVIEAFGNLGDSIMTLLATPLDELGGNIIDGLLNGIKSALTNIGTWIRDNIFNPFIEGFCSVFGISSPSRTMKPYGKYIIDGLLNGILAPFKQIVKWLKENIVDPFINGIKSLFGLDGEESSLFTIGKNIIDGLLDGITNVFEGISNWIETNIFNPFINAVKSLFGIGKDESALVTVGKDVINGLLGGISKVFEGISDWVGTTIVNPLTNAIKTLFGLDGEESVLYTLGSELINGFIGGMTVIAETIAGWVQEHVIDPIVGGFTSMKESLDALFGGDENPFGTAAMEEATPITDAYTESLNKLGATVGDTSNDEAWLRMQQVINDLYDKELLSEGAFNGLNEQIANYLSQGIPFTERTEILGATFEKANVSVDDLNKSLSDTNPAAQKATEGIEDLGNKSNVTQGNTSAVGEALTKFNGLSLTTPLKLAILALAIRALGEDGKLSDDDITDLQTTLDEYDPKKPEESMQKIIDKFDATSVSAEDLGKAVADASFKAQQDVKGNLNLLVNNIDTTNTKVKTKSKQGGKNIGDGYVEGIKEKESDVNRESANMVTGGINAMDTAADSHSPSRETYKRGGYLVQGLINGLRDASSGIAQEASNIINTFVRQFDTNKNALNGVGRDLIYSFLRGINDNLSLLNGAGVTMVDYIYGGVNSQLSGFWNIGYNITVGMINGLRYGSSYVVDWARGIAMEAYNAARYALGIRSPSKKFAYIGEMITAGLSNGIAESGDNAVNAVSEVTDNIVDAAEQANPTISLQTTVDKLDAWTIKLDNVLTDFINRFSVITTALTNFNDNLIMAYKVPEIATGNLLPSAINILSENATQLNMLSRLVQSLSQSVITREELTDVLSTVLPRYLGDVYLGDEQLARHVNAGNLKLQYKNSIIK